MKKLVSTMLVAAAVSVGYAPATAVSADDTHAKWLTDPTVFEASYYADQNDDVRKEFGYDESKLSEHWREHGIKAGRRSSPVFDVRYYLQENADVARSVGKENYYAAAEHWYKSGRREGRPSHPDFQVKVYLQKNPDVAKTYGADNYLEAIDHYLTNGYRKGRVAK